MVRAREQKTRGQKMMNVLGLSLLLTSLVTAAAAAGGFFTPNPEKESPTEAVIVKEGHRVVVVEYEKDDGNTKVSIAPRDEKALSGKMIEEDAEGKETHHNHKSTPTEVVCDAYGKCKRLVAGAVGKTKEAVAGSWVSEEAKGAVGKVKDAASDASHKVQEARQSVEDSANQGKDKLSEKASEIKEAAKQGTKQRAHDAIEAAKRVRDEAEREARMKMEGSKEKVVEKAREAEEWVERSAKKKGAQETLRRAGEVGMDLLEYAVRVVSRVGHLMGFSAAYGMCVWVTFASSYVLAGALPRKQFGMVQSKVYPVYFKAMAYSVGVAFLGSCYSYCFSSRKRSGGLFQCFNLAAALAMTLVNLLWLEPRATKVMFERMKKEKEDETVGGGRSKDSTAEIAGRGRDRDRDRRKSKGDADADVAGNEAAEAEAEMIGLTSTLQRLNSYSSSLNVLTLMSLTWHLLHLAQRLHMD
ncbi:uncharacterized protein LOC127246723 [Andrographis paniculata]|uniref:uncharacterized protein LOC127246723 n=1 Tax=Andrographis paniculata TaxID=175694 RepID=UPI0021E8FFA6|nr:uncharacterized protein LOC127246723 [Andrographis paniculata]